MDVGSRGGAEAGSWVPTWVTEGLEQLDHRRPLAAGWGGAGFCWEWGGGVMGLAWLMCLAWRIPWKEEPDRLQSMGSQESDTT